MAWLPQYVTAFYITAVTQKRAEHLLGVPVQVGMKLFCQDCDAEGYMPFALANSSGIELIVETAIPKTGSGFVGKACSDFGPASCNDMLFRETGQCRHRHTV